MIHERRGAMGGSMEDAQQEAANQAADDADYAEANQPSD